MVVRAYEEATFNEWYNGERDTWMDDMFFPALGDVLVVDASEPVCENQYWQAVWVPTTGVRKFVHPAVLARIHFTAQYLGLDHFDRQWDSTSFFQSALDVGGQTSNMKGHVGNCRLILRCKINMKLIESVASGLRQLWRNRPILEGNTATAVLEYSTVCWYCDHGKHRSRACAYVASMMCERGRFARHSSNRSGRYCRDYHECHGTNSCSREEIGVMIINSLREGR